MSLLLLKPAAASRERAEQSTAPTKTMSEKTPAAPPPPNGPPRPPSIAASQESNDVVNPERCLHAAAAATAAAPNATPLSGSTADPLRRNDSIFFHPNPGDATYPSDCNSLPANVGTTCGGVERTAAVQPINQTMAIDAQQVQSRIQTGDTFTTQPQHHPLSSITAIPHPFFSQYSMTYPQQQLSYEQQHSLLLQHQLIVQQAAQQSILLQQLQSRAIATSAGVLSQEQPSAAVTYQQMPVNQNPSYGSQQLDAQSILNQLSQLQQSQNEAAAFFALSQTHAAPSSQGLQLPAQQDPSTFFMQPPPYNVHPVYWNLQLLLQGITPVGVGAMDQGVEASNRDNQEIDDTNSIDENIEYDDDNNDDDDNAELLFHSEP